MKKDTLFNGAILSFASSINPNLQKCTQQENFYKIIKQKKLSRKLKGYTKIHTLSTYEVEGDVSPGKPLKFFKKI